MPRNDPTECPLPGRVCLYSAKLAVMVFRLAYLPVAVMALMSTAMGWDSSQDSVREHYRKIEYWVPVRDGVKLYVNVYVPTDKPGKHPIMLERTPYHSEPYGPNAYRDGFPGSEKFRSASYIFAMSDVRGTGMSDGKLVMALPKKHDGAPGIDESTDTYDTIDFLVKHVPDNNGNVGMWGISYPGYFAAVGGIDSHPALKAISPQAPCANWFYGDDIHHNGAFFFQDMFDFLSFFGPPRTKLGEWAKGPTIPDYSSAYDFFLKIGSLANVEPKYYKGQVRFWDDILGHPNYDQYWKDEELPSKMKGVKCAVLTVGGWYDAEDQWGALNLPAEPRRNQFARHGALVPWRMGRRNWPRSREHRFWVGYISVFSGQSRVSFLRSLPTRCKCCVTDEGHDVRNRRRYMDAIQRMATCQPEIDSLLFEQWKDPKRIAADGSRMRRLCLGPFQPNPLSGRLPNIQGSPFGVPTLGSTLCPETVRRPHLQRPSTQR